MHKRGGRREDIQELEEEDNADNDKKRHDQICEEERGDEDRKRKRKRKWRK